MIDIKQKETVVSLGMFDGVHMGHRALLSEALKIARDNNNEPIVYTFENHPMSILGMMMPKLLMTLEERTASIKNLGISKIEAVRFNEELASMEPLDFITGLVSRYHIKHIVAGFNYSFGKFGKGTSDDLIKYGKLLGYNVKIIPPVIFQGCPVSSTRIRQSLENGCIEEANLMLQSDYTLSGRVMSNKHIGTKIGYPTANISVPEEKQLPASGVYAAVVRLNNKENYYAVTNIGNNPTVLGSNTTIESHLIGFSGDLYDSNIRVMLCRYLRGEVKFNSTKALAEQIKKDIEVAEDYFKKSNPIA